MLSPMDFTNSHKFQSIFFYRSQSSARVSGPILSPPQTGMNERKKENQQTKNQPVQIDALFVDCEPKICNTSRGVFVVLLFSILALVSPPPSISKGAVQWKDMIRPWLCSEWICKEAAICTLAQRTCSPVQGSSV